MCRCLSSVHEKRSLVNSRILNRRSFHCAIEPQEATGVFAACKRLSTHTRSLFTCYEPFGDDSLSLSVHTYRDDTNARLLRQFTLTSRPPVCTGRPVTHFESFSRQYAPERLEGTQKCQFNFARNDFLRLKSASVSSCFAIRY